MSTSSRPPRPRALFVAALLLLTLALAGAIALQAYRNFLGHKATAERVLRDYSRLAPRASRSEPKWRCTITRSGRRWTRSRGQRPGDPTPSFRRRADCR